MLRSTSLRVLRPEDLPEVTEVLSRDPVADVFVASRVQAVGLDPARLGGEMWGFVADGRLDALCHAGANLVPVQAGDEAVRAFADRARRQGRRCASIVGDRAAVTALWAELEPAWGPPREVRDPQPLMAISSAPQVASDPGVRPIGMDELDVLLPACVAMFTEEVGVSPLGVDGGVAYRSRVAELVRAGRAFARIENGRVLFKAEVGSASTEACQVQGVWVPPELRGRGLAAPGMAAVVELALEAVAPVVSLYVNDYNEAARATYRRVGFTDVGAFMSVLF
jgi:predicted GNAT family acetyltransferase